jgi:hypothetical protein
VAVVVASANLYYAYSRLLLRPGRRSWSMKSFLDALCFESGIIPVLEGNSVVSDFEEEVVLVQVI